MKPITKRIALILLLSTLVFAPAVVFGQIPGDPTITETQPNYTTNTLRIVGTGFGTTKGTVSLSGTGLVVDSWTATQIVATLPATIVPGSYTLTVSGPVRTFFPSFTATFDVTLGAVGPQGPAGPSGPSGPSGPTGLTNGISAAVYGMITWIDPTQAPSVYPTIYGSGTSLFQATAYGCYTDPNNQYITCQFQILVLNSAPFSAPLPVNCQVSYVNGEIGPYTNPFSFPPRILPGWATVAVSPQTPQGYQLEVLINVYAAPTCVTSECPPTTTDCISGPYQCLAGTGVTFLCYQ